MADGRIQVEVIRAWPRRHEARTVALPEGADVASALAAAGLGHDGCAGYAVYGEQVGADHPLRDGDRVELLRPLLIDPKEARRRRARK